MTLLLFVHLVALLFSFFVAGALLGALFSSTFRERLTAIVRDLLLHRAPHNPILTPGRHPWMAEAVLNPAAAVIDDRTHLLYRAIGADGLSRLGYASSPDGLFFDVRTPYPAYVAAPVHHEGEKRYAPMLYPSGGSWGGCEDPRMVTIGDDVYVTFNMFDGWDNIRVAAITITKDDFLARRFHAWRGPYVLSRPGERQKNWVLFPEKINGKFALLHSVNPNVEIAYIDRLEDIGTSEPFIESWVGARDGVRAREEGWDSFVRGAGPPPVKTKAGWLLFYHAIDKREPGRYKLGALLLDLHNPTRVLHRAQTAVLSPDATYENEGKPGVVYACGAVVRNGTLFLYYGGGDKVVCVATAKLDTLLDALVAGKDPRITELRVTETR